MHYVRCDICRSDVLRRGFRRLENAEGWFFGFLKTEDREVQFDLCPACGPQATSELIEILDASRR